MLLMKLHVQVLEARGLKTFKPGATLYVRLRLGRTKAKSSALPTPSWHEDFTFHVDDLQSHLSLSLWEHDRFAHVFLGRLQLPVHAVLNADHQSLPPSWYPLQKRHKRSKTPVSGEVCLSLSLYGKTHYSKSTLQYHSDLSTSSANNTPERNEFSSTHSSESSHSTNATASPSGPALLPPNDGNSDKGYFVPLDNAISYLSSLFSKQAQSVSSTQSQSVFESPYGTSVSEESDSLDEDESIIPASFFEDDGHSVEASEEDFPPPLPGGILLDKLYAMSAKSLNALLFSPGSQFVQDLVASQKTTDLIEGPWKRDAGYLPRRTVTYTKAASKLVKAVKAIEEQEYVRADDKGFVVSVSVSTPDAPYGSTFRIELQFCLFSGEDLQSGGKTSRLRISWGINFISSTMMKSIIENGARQGLKDNYSYFADLLEKYAKPVTIELRTTPTTTTTLLVGPKSDWDLAKEYFLNLRVVLTLISLFIILVHIFFARPYPKTGLEVWRLDLPDTFREFVTSAIVGIQVEHVVQMIRRFLQARVLRVSDHGIKAQGSGWLLSVTLVNAENLPPSDECGSSNPYVEFTCNGKTRTSSVKLQTLNPEWQELFEFDATEDPPSTMDVEVFDFEGPFTEAESLGYAEINFLKQNSEELSDLWVPLQGKNARVSGSRIHLRIILSNSSNADTVTQYIQKVEKEVGKKIAMRSPQKNSSFQKLFALPFEEFLINDFSCALKRKLPLQGRLFLSPRLLAFYSNIFGHKIKFSILWEDIGEIRETSPVLGSVGMLLNRAVLVYTKKGRAIDAREGAKSVDFKGRFKFQFQSFVRFGPAYKSMMALWKNRTLGLEQKMEYIANLEEKDADFAIEDKLESDSGTFLGIEDANLVEVYSTRLPLSVESLTSFYASEKLDQKVAEMTGCLNYTATPWEPVAEREDLMQRQVNYKLNLQISRFGSNVTCIQQKGMQNAGSACFLDEVLTLHDVPFADHFQIQVRKELRDLPSFPIVTECKVFLGIAWHKSTKFQHRISKNIFDKYSKYLKECLDITVKEVLALKECN